MGACLLAGPVQADECGGPPTDPNPPPAENTITCDGSDQSAAGGIGYLFGDANNYTTNFQGNLAVDPDPGPNGHPGRHGLDVDHEGSGGLTINMLGGSIDTMSGGQNGIRVRPQTFKGRTMCFGGEVGIYFLLLSVGY